jgi:hypothetical protein
MLRANVTQIFIVDGSYQSRVLFFKNLNHSLINLTDTELAFEKDGNIMSFHLTYDKEDFISKTFLSKFEDETPFRVLRPSDITRKMSLLKNNYKDSFSVGSINPDGYSVHFILTERDDIRNIQIEQKGVEEQLEKLAAGAILALQNDLHTNFYKISKRLIVGLNANNKDIHQLENGSLIAQILKDNIELYDDNERIIISKM